MAMERRKAAEDLAAFGTGVAFGTVMGSLLATAPAKAAEPETKLDYLITLTQAIGSLLTEIHNSQLDEIEQLKAIASALGAAPGGEVNLLTPWVGKEPVQLLNQAVRAAGVITTDSMVDWTKGKRLLIKVESSLDQAIQLQAIGNITNTMTLATNVGLATACAANGNASIGLAWDDWIPYVGVRITLPIAPANGILTIWAVVQE